MKCAPDISAVSCCNLCATPLRSTNPNLVMFQVKKTASLPSVMTQQLGINHSWGFDSFCNVKVCRCSPLQLLEHVFDPREDRTESGQDYKRGHPRASSMDESDWTGRSGGDVEQTRISLTWTNKGRGYEFTCACDHNVTEGETAGWKDRDRATRQVPRAITDWWWLFSVRHCDSDDERLFPELFGFFFFSVSPCVDASLWSCVYFYRVGSKNKIKNGRQRLVVLEGQ